MFVFVLDGFAVFLGRPGRAEAGFRGRFRQDAAQPRPGRPQAGLPGRFRQDAGQPRPGRPQAGLPGRFFSVDFLGRPPARPGRPEAGLHENGPNGQIFGHLFKGSSSLNPPKIRRFGWWDWEILGELELALMEVFSLASYFVQR